MKKLGVSICFFVLTGTVMSQVCEGNLGENIFVDGDFGFGSDNNLMVDPNIAPGYSYTTGGPPFDGSYILTNNTGGWSGLFETWLPLRDNSTNPNGYMMVVNASFEPGIFYEQEVDGLCENTNYVFQADIINVVRQGVLDHIRPNVTFLLDDVVQITTGDIPQDETWKTYGFVFTPPPGKTSVKLTIQNNAPGGIGNDLALDNISFQACGPEALILPREVENICEDGSPISLNATINGDQFPAPVVQWQESFDEGNTWVDIPNANQRSYVHDKLTSGFYFYRYLVSNAIANLSNPKCAIISNTKVVFVQPKEYTIIDSICAGNTFEVGNSVYDQTGIYTDSLISSIGCDSVVTLDLTIVTDQGITTQTNIMDPTCAGFNNGSITIESIENGYLPLSQSLVNLSTNTPVSGEQLEAGGYFLRIEDRYQCFFEEQIQIIDPPPFELDLGRDTTVNLGQPLNLSVQSNYTIQDFESNFSDSICQNNCLQIEWFPTESRTFTVQAISMEGCRTIDSIMVTVIPNRSLYVPNVFSPNGDGKNDLLTVFAAKPLVEKIKKFQIFDRWGQLVFEKFDFQPNNEELGWSGEGASGLMSDGIYIYIVDALFMDGIIASFSGDVLLMKN